MAKKIVTLRMNERVIGMMKETVCDDEGERDGEDDEKPEAEEEADGDIEEEEEAEAASKNHPARGHCCPPLLLENKQPVMVSVALPKSKISRPGSASGSAETQKKAQVGGERCTNVLQRLQLIGAIQPTLHMASAPNNCHIHARCCWQHRVGGLVHFV